MKNVLGRNMTGDLASYLLDRFERCRTSIEEEERLVKLFDENKNEEPSLMSFDGKEPSPLLCYLAPSKEQVTKRLYFHYRLYEKLTAALCAGIRRMPEKSLRDYLIWHYLYRFTNEAIAEVMHYSVRQIYRQASQARCSLSKTLRLPPRPRVYKFHRFRITRKLHRLPKRLAS